MIKRVLLLILILAAFFMAACEKDDICVDGDTPLMILRFYDAENPDNFKSVTSLRIIGSGQTDPVDTFADRSDTDSIAIPLRADQSSTQFILILNSADEDDAETGNLDTLNFQYSTEEVFISRACGFVANYNELNPGLIPDADNWIQTIEVANAFVTKQDSAHVKIFH